MAFFEAVKSKAKTQSKTVTAGTSTTTVVPDSGYDGLSDVTVNPTPSQEKTITSSLSSQTVTPDSGKLLSKVTINAYTPTGNASTSDVLSGKTFMNSNGAQTGAMPNRGAVSGTATPSQPYTIPVGYHNGNGVVTASGGSYNIVDYLFAQIQDTTVNKKIYTATQNVNVVANFKMLDMGQLVGGKVALYNSNGTKLRDLFVKEYSAGGGTPTNISFSMSNGDYIQCYDMIAQSTAGYAYILAALFALT